MSLVQKITNLITSLDFIQSDPVSDVVKKADYKLYFISDNNEKISNENIYIADNWEPESQIYIVWEKYAIYLILLQHGCYMEMY